MPISVLLNCGVSLRDVLASQEDSVLLQYVLDQLVDPQGFLKEVQELYQSDEESFDTLNFKDGRVFERLSRPLIKEAALQGRVWSFRDITERNRMEAKLEDERTLLRTLIDNLPDRVYVKDAQGHKVISNMADWQASGGKTMEDVIGKTDLETYPPELAQDYWAVDKAVIDSGTPILNHEEPGLDSHGHPVQVLSSKLPLRDGQGKIVGLVGIGRDITERKQAEEALHASEERFRSLYENVPVGIYRTTPDGRSCWPTRPCCACCALIRSNKWRSATWDRLTTNRIIRVPNSWLPGKRWRDYRDRICLAYLRRGHDLRPGKRSRCPGCARANTIL